MLALDRRMPGSRDVNRLGCFFVSVFLAIATTLPGCGDDPQAPAPGLPDDSPDYRGLYDATGGALEFSLEAPDGSFSPFRLVVTAIEQDPDSQLVRAQVAVRNASNIAVAGPIGIHVTDFVPEDVRPMNAACVESECLNCPTSCVFDHGGTYGDDGVLEPGETSASVQWVFHDPANASFAFRARLNLPDPQPITGQISGFVFGDLNGDGHRQEGEFGIGGQSISLVFDNNVQMADTDERGHYAFSVSEPGLYELIWNLRDPAGQCSPTTPEWMQVLILRRPDGTLSGFDRGDFGCLAKPFFGVAVNGAVFSDLNRNGVRDRGEPGVPGVLVSGATPNCPTFAPIETYTDESGRYALHLPECQPPFVVQHEPVAGHVDTSPNPVIFDRPPPSGTILVANFGVAPEDSSQSDLFIQGVVYLDGNRNGVRDPGEAGVADVEVTASALECMLPALAYTRTDQNGQYRLIGAQVPCPLPWAVQHYGDWIDTTPNPVILNGPPPDGSNTFEVNFGVAPPDSIPPPGSPLAIEGTVFADWDRDGVRDPDEAGIPNVEVQLLSTCRMLRVTRTNLRGHYRFAPEVVAACAVTSVLQSLPVFAEHTTKNPQPLYTAAGDAVFEVHFGVIPERAQP